MESSVQLESDLCAHEGSEAIFWEKSLILHVRVTGIPVSDRYINFRITGIPPKSGAEGWFWPERSMLMGSCREYFYGGRHLWLAIGYVNWRVFLAPEVTGDVLRIRAGFPESGRYKPYDARYHALKEPLQRALVREASGQLQRLFDAVDEIGTEQEQSALYAALKDAAATLSSSYRQAFFDLPMPLLNFVKETHAQSGKALTKSEADHLIAIAFRVGRSLGLPF